MARKIVVIGGGSIAFVPTLIENLIRTPELAGSTLTLMDIDPSASKLMADFGRKRAKKNKIDLKIESTTSQSRALDGADFVITTFAVGGIEAWKLDMRIPQKYGIYNGVADSVGVSGISRALRQIPVMMAVCKDMKTLCPDAWLINYANPMGCLCKIAQCIGGIKAIGFGTGTPGIRKFFAELLKTNAEEIYVKVGGINHLVWIVDLKVNHKNAYPLIKNYMNRHGMAKSPVCFELYDVYGLFPGPGDQHVAEFYPFFYKGAKEMQKYSLDKVNVPERFAQMRKRILEKIQEGEELPQIETEQATEVIKTIINNDNKVFHGVNVLNKGFITNLCTNAVVEVPALIGRDGIQGISIGELPEGIAEVLQSFIFQQELTVKASLSKDKNLALQALLTDPMIKSIADARALLNELLTAHAPYLSYF